MIVLEVLGLIILGIQTLRAYITLRVISSYCAISARCHVKILEELEKLK